MIVYNFKTIEEFVAWLDTEAKNARANQQNFHPRSHAHKEFMCRAYTLESVAAMVRNSNLGVVC